MVVSELQRRCHVLSDGTEVLSKPLADRLQGLEPIGALVGMDTNAFRVAMIHGDEDVGQYLKPVGSARTSLAIRVSIPLSSGCGSFRRGRMFRQTLTHPSGRCFWRA